MTSTRVIIMPKGISVITIEVEVQESWNDSFGYAMVHLCSSVTLCSAVQQASKQACHRSSSTLFKHAARLPRTSLCTRSRLGLATTPRVRRPLAQPHRHRITSFTQRQQVNKSPF